MNIVDLHVHSTKSDGSYTPSELVEHAIKKGLSAFALTDHDTTAGIDEAIAAAAGKPIEVIPGIEFSSEYEGRDIHIVGLYLDYKSDFFQRRLVNFVNGRIMRNQEMCRRLQEHGVAITYEELVSEFPGSVITRAHYARYLLSHGYVKSLKEAFDRYVGDNAPCFVPRKKITPMRAVEIILKAGGIPILAHPILYHMSSARLDKLVASLKEVGLIGIEAIYSTYAPSEEREIRRLAERYDLCISGGSDFHGSAKPGLDLATGYGRLFIPEEVLVNLKRKHAEMKAHPEAFRRNKILFTDLDGTFLNKEKQIGDYTREVMETFTKAGNKLVLCSGRDINSVRSVKEYLHLDYPGMYLIGYNGGQIVECDTGKTLYRIALTYEQVCHIREAASQHGLHFHTYSDTNILSPCDDEELHFYQRTIKTPVIFSQDLHEIRDCGACKCLVIAIDRHEELEAFVRDLSSWAEQEQITLVFSNNNYLEIFPSASGKGAAVRKLCELLNISPLLSIAAGDAENDISMIEAAGIGIAMYNASDDVKAAATMVTALDNNHDGLARELLDLV